jgi:hypothetical protein
LTKKQEAFLNRYTKGTWSVNPTTGLVDIQGSFDSYSVNKGEKSFFGVKFGNVTGDFACIGNKLQSLEGAPKKVDGNFDCNQNKLQSLEGAPQEVGGNFYCHKNKLQSLEGAPQKVDGDFRCSSNLIQSLVGAPREVGGDFICTFNQLQSLAGAPQKVVRNFFCEYNELRSLAGAPQKVGGNFYCTFNPLQSLEGAPLEGKGLFECNQFRLMKGEWNMEGWLEVLRNGSKLAKKLILTFPYIQPDWWNSELQRDPGKAVHLLASWWKGMPEDMKSKIKIPSGYENEFDLFSGFDELGFF